MSRGNRIVTSLAVAGLGGLSFLSSAQGGCPCQRGGTSAPAGVIAPIPMTMDTAQGLPSGMFPVGESWEGTVPGVNVLPGTSLPTGSSVSGLAAPGSIGPGYSAATATTWQPPPGTIGQTYQMKSRPVPVKMHPRAAIVDVHIPNATNVRVHDMNVYRTQDFLDGFQDDQDPTVWHFTSEPLIPGIPHIYRIEARFPGPDGKEKMEERYVRLIMGRVIEVTF